jgi:small subunit ribosomal protein S17
MADENENTEIEETPEAEEPVAEVEETPAAEEPEVTEEPEVEEPAAEADPEPEVAEEPESTPDEAEPVEEAEPIAAEVEEAAAEPEAPEPVDESEPVAAEAEDAPAETDEAPAEAAAVSEPKKKRKRPPRSERPRKTRPKRVASTERKPITRLEKPEHERGRRQERQGTVVSDAADKTIVVRVEVVKLHPRYKKVVKRSTRLHAHDEENQAKLGDVVRIVETRPLSRMKRWRLQEIVEAAK